MTKKVRRKLRWLRACCISCVALACLIVILWVSVGRIGLRLGEGDTGGIHAEFPKIYTGGDRDCFELSITFGNWRHSRRTRLLPALGFYYTFDEATGSQPAYFHAEVAYLFLIFLSACVAGIALILRRQCLRVLATAAPECQHCGYDLRAHHLGDKCPECGTLISDRSERNLGNLISPNTMNRRGNWRRTISSLFFPRR